MTFCNMFTLTSFNRHLNKKGVSGQIKVNYDEKTLSVEVKTASSY